MSTVLVTGGSGFVGVHTVAALLRAGHDVRATVRSTKREPEVREMLERDGLEPGAKLSFYAADLSADEGWREAVTGCEYVHHVASPFPPKAPKHEDELIVPAREGTLRVLRAARESGVKRVVLTSSFASIAYGHPMRETPFDERDWTDLTGDVRAYVKSKTIAERAAWDYVKENPALELAVVNPVGIFGPVLGADLSASIVLVRRLIAGAMPGSPQLYFAIVDVRDVADLHLRAMTHPDAKGERFLAVSGETMSVHEMAKLLRARLGAEGRRVPRFQLPNWLVRLSARRDPELAQVAGELGRKRRASGDKARRLLGWSPRTNEEALLASARSLIDLKLIDAT